jgi:anti-anti-sigma factor
MKKREAALGASASKSRDLMTASSGSAHAPPLRVETITNGDTNRILIHGEADIANVDQLAAALTGIQLDGTRSVFLDASGLAFFDVAALRCLIVFAQSVKQTGREITTCGAKPMLHEVARMLEFQDDLGLH